MYPGEVDLSVVVPAFNESARLGRTLSTVRGYLGDGVRSWELLVVDDGSTDDTAAIAARESEREPRVRLIQSGGNHGKGHAVRTGLLASRGRTVLMCDADLSTPIDDLEVLEPALKPGVAVAIGSRGLDLTTIAVHQNKVRESLGRLGNRFIRLAAVPGIADTQCGFKLFDGPMGRAVFARCRVNGWGFDIEALYLCRRLGWDIAEVPVRWAHAKGSRLRASAYVQVLLDVARTRWWHRGARIRPVSRQELAGPAEQSQEPQRPPPPRPRTDPDDTRIEAQP